MKGVTRCAAIGKLRFSTESSRLRVQSDGSRLVRRGYRRAKSNRLSSSARSTTSQTVNGWRTNWRGAATRRWRPRE
jgi:hypothetical protein